MLLPGAEPVSEATQELVDEEVRRIVEEAHQDVSRLLSEPTYDVILGWNPADLPADWSAVRDRWVALNWIRAAITWAAFGLFLAAFYAHLT